MRIKNGFSGIDIGDEVDNEGELDVCVFCGDFSSNDTFINKVQSESIIKHLAKVFEVDLHKISVQLLSDMHSHLVSIDEYKDYKPRISDLGSNIDGNEIRKDCE